MVLSGIAKAPHTRAAFLKTRNNICATISGQIHTKIAVHLFYTFLFITGDKI